MDCEIGRNKRCEECIRPVCQRQFKISYRWDQVGDPMNPYGMHDLFVGV